MNPTQNLKNLPNEEEKAKSEILENEKSDLLANGDVNITN